MADSKLLPKYFTNTDNDKCKTSYSLVGMDGISALSDKQKEIITIENNKVEVKSLKFDGITLKAKLKASTIYGDTLFIDIKVSKQITCLMQTVKPVNEAAYVM